MNAVKTRLQRLEKQRPAAVKIPIPELWDHKADGLYYREAGVCGDALTLSAEDFQKHQAKRRCAYPGASGPFAVIAEMEGAKC